MKMLHKKFLMRHMEAKGLTIILKITNVVKIEGWFFINFATSILLKR